MAPNDALLEKLKSNLQEVRARGGELFVIADADTRIESGNGLHLIRVPEHYGALSSIRHVVPLQLLAYHTACARGTDVEAQEPGQEHDRGMTVAPHPAWVDLNFTVRGPLAQQAPAVVRARLVDFERTEQSPGVSACAGRGERRSR